MIPLPTRFGYWAAQEQYPPEVLLDFVVRAEAAGFTTTATSDHFHPWFHTGGQSAFTWAWMAAACERTRAMELGTAVTAVVYRYPPALVAQAFATLGRLYPGRIFLGVGTGEAMNEVPFGMEWPGYDERAARLEEAIRIIQLLWSSDDFVDFDGRYFKLRRARLYTKAKGKVPIFMAASGPKSARLAGRLADGLLSYIHDAQELKSKLFPAFEEGARAAGREPASLERILEFSVSYSPDYDRAYRAIRRWASTSITGALGRNIVDPRELEAEGDKVPTEELAKRWLISDNIESIVKECEEMARLGFTRVYLHSTSPDEEVFIRDFGKQAFPVLHPEDGRKLPRSRS